MLQRLRIINKILKKLGTPCLIHQPKYNMFERWIEKELMDTLEDEGIGCIVFSIFRLKDRQGRGMGRQNQF